MIPATIALAATALMAGWSAFVYRATQQRRSDIERIASSLREQLDSQSALDEAVSAYGKTVERALAALSGSGSGPTGGDEPSVAVEVFRATKGELERPPSGSAKTARVLKRGALYGGGVVYAPHHATAIGAGAPHEPTAWGQVYRMV